MPDTSFGWKSEGQFLASLGAKSVLPQKVIHVDDAPPAHASELTSGGLYVAESITRQTAVFKEPRMACPNCGQVCSGIAGAKPQYEIPQTNAPCLPLGDNTVEPPRMLYSLEPCGCKASQEWAAAFSVELNRRLEGADPRPIVDMTEKERQARVASLEQRISKLYSAQAKATIKEHKEAIEYRLVILTDQLMRLLPGAHNKVPPVNLTPKVAQWASDKGYHKPPPAIEITPITDGNKALESLFNGVEAITDSLMKGLGIPPELMSQPGGATTAGAGDMKSLQQMKNLLHQKNPSLFMEEFKAMYQDPPNQMFKSEWIKGAAKSMPQQSPPQGKGVYIDPATNLVYDESGQVIGIPMSKPGDDAGYGSAYPMPKNLGQSQAPNAGPKQVNKPLGSTPVLPGKVMQDQTAAGQLNDKLTELHAMAQEILQKRNMHPANTPGWNEFQQKYIQLMGSIKATENQLSGMPSAFTTYKPLASVANDPQAQAAQSQLEAAKAEHKKTLGGILANTSVEELVVIFGADKFQLPKQWLTSLLNSFQPSRPIVSEVIKKITGQSNLAEIATKAVFIEKNLRGHRDKGQNLAPLTVQFLAYMCKQLVSPNNFTVDGPSPKPVAQVTAPPPEEQTEEQFHEQFKRKRRRIRRLDT